MKKTIYILLSSLLLSGCGATKVSTTKQDNQSSKNNESNSVNIPSSELALTDFSNMHAAFTDDGAIVPSGEGDGLLALGTAVQYCDPSISSQFTYYCFETGCKHTDYTCHCYIGNALQFITWHGQWYYIRKNAYDAFELIQHNPESNDRKILLSYERSNDGSVYEFINSMFLSNGVLYISFTHFETDSDTLQTESSGYIDTIDLETCEHTQLFDLNEDDNFFGGNGKNAAIVHSQTKESVNGEIIPYHELNVLNLESGELIKITDSDSGFNVFSDMYQLINKDTLVYIESDTIHILDLSSLDNSIIYKSDKTILSAWFFGNKVRFLEKAVDGSSLEENMIDSDGNNKINFPSMIDSDRQVTKFAPVYLTEHGEIGRYSDSTSDALITGWISESNYLNGNFKQIVNVRK